MTNSLKTCDFCNCSVIDDQKILENKQVIILLPKRPVSEGHVLIITKRHVQYLSELSEVEFKSIQGSIKQLIKVFDNFMHASGFHILNNNGKSADQHINHAHFHVFFRNEVGVSPFDILSKKVLRHELTVDQWKNRLVNLRKLISR